MSIGLPGGGADVDVPSQIQFEPAPDPVNRPLSIHAEEDLPFTCHPSLLMEVDVVEKGGIRQSLSRLDGLHHDLAPEDFQRRREIDPVNLSPEVNLAINLFRFDRREVEPQTPGNQDAFRLQKADPGRRA